MKSKKPLIKANGLLLWVHITKILQHLQIKKQI